MSWRTVLLRRRSAAPELSNRLACHAPFTSMYLDQRGWVRACCMNVNHTLGNISDRPLSQIWHAEPARELRRAIERGDLTQGCEFCKWQVDEGRGHLAYAKWFRELDVDQPDPEWPQQLEFSISNTCNLQCVMCNGEWSSSIRSQREGLTPLPKVYDDAFFEDLAAFLPHLRSVKFLGGEPFLATETLRIMEMLVDRGLAPSCHVTTNGTQWSPRVERILDLLPVDVAVSVDAATAETHEAIRVGSSWEALQRNLDRFQQRAEARGTGVTLTFCLMRNNWHELIDFCRMADERGVGCTVNTVTMPEVLSLYRLPADELASVLATMDDQDRTRGGSLTLSAATWLGELERLRAHLVDRRDGRSVTGVDVRSTDSIVDRPFDRAEQLRRAEQRDAILAMADEFRARHVPPGGWRLQVDAEGTLFAIEPDGDVLGLRRRDLIGRDIDELAGVMIERYGTPLHSHTIEERTTVQAVEVAHPRRRTIRVVIVPAIEEDGSTVGTIIDVNWLDVPS